MALRIGASAVDVTHTIKNAALSDEARVFSCFFFDMDARIGNGLFRSRWVIPVIQFLWLDAASFADFNDYCEAYDKMSDEVVKPNALNFMNETEMPVFDEDDEAMSFFEPIGEYDLSVSNAEIIADIFATEWWESKLWAQIQKAVKEGG